MDQRQHLSHRLADIATLAATAVAGQLRDAFRAPMEIATKRDNHDLVTKHDRLAEERIREILHRHVPDSVIVGEEGGESGTGDVRWYVDPIDGTAAFASGLAFFCTSIGAVVNDEIVAGVVLDPIGENLFHATIDGAFCNGRRLATSTVTDEANAMVITGYPTARDLTRDGTMALDRLGRLIDTYSSVRRPGSAALTLSHVAAGWVDAAFGATVSPWDVTAGILLVERAGGHYRPLGGSEGRPAWAAPGYVATSAHLRADVLTSIADQFAPSGQPV